MPVDDYLFLLMGMLDVISPQATEPKGDKFTRLTREAHAAAVADKPRSGW